MLKVLVFHLAKLSKVTRSTFAARHMSTSPAPPPPRVCQLDIYHQSTQHRLPAAIDRPYWNKPHLQSPPWHPHTTASCLLPLQTLTACADFGSLLFSTNPLPDFPSFTNTRGFHRRRVGKEKEKGGGGGRQPDVRWAATINCLKDK